MYRSIAKLSVQWNSTCTVCIEHADEKCSAEYRCYDYAYNLTFR